MNRRKLGIIVMLIMKPINLIVACLMFMGCAHLDKTEKAMLGTAVALTACDAYQTSRIDSYDNLEEGNQLFKDSEQATFFVAANIGLVYGITYLLTPKLRKWFLGAYIGVRGWTVKHNYDLGLKF